MWHPSHVLYKASAGFVLFPPPLNQNVFIKIMGRGESTEEHGVEPYLHLTEFILTTKNLGKLMSQRLRISV